MSGIIDLTGESDNTDRKAIGVASDSEDEDLKKAIAMSLEDQHKTTSTTRTQTVDPTSSQTMNTLANGLAGLDRKAMEAERLARLKRKRGLEEDTEFNMGSKSRQISPPPLKRLTMKPISSREAQSGTGFKVSPPASNPFDFSNPTVLLTSHPSRHTANGLTAISLRDIVSAPRPGFKLKSVLLSSFIADFDWLLPHFDTQSTSFVIVLHAQSAEHRQLLQSDFSGLPNVRLVLPKCMGGSGNMHSKIMLLFFKSEQADQNSEICRIVITSANLTSTDWGVNNVMENVVFVIDAPKKQHDWQNTETQFEQKFIQQLQMMEVPEKVLQKLKSFDLSATKHLNFVHSVSQSRIIDLQADGRSEHSPLVKPTNVAKQSSVPKPISDSTQDLVHGQARVGLLALSDAVSALGLSSTKSDPTFPPRLDFVTSSLGNLSAAFLRQLYSAVCGTLDPGSAISSKSKTKKLPSHDDEKDLDNLIQRNLRIYFPSDKTVRMSKGGSATAGTICFSRKWWNDNDIIKNCLYDCIGSRKDGILMHSKILYVRFQKPKVVVDSEGNSQPYAGYAYVGSANLSESAWGRITFDSKAKQPKMTCRNWESGVVVPIRVNSGDWQGARNGAVVGYHLSKPMSSEATDSCGNETSTHEEAHSSLNRDGQTVNAVHPTSLTEARPMQVDEQHRLSYAGKFRGSSLKDIFSSTIPVPVKDDGKLIDKGVEPWFFRD